MILLEWDKILVEALGDIWLDGLLAKEIVHKSITFCDHMLDVGITDEHAFLEIFNFLC